MDRAHRDLVVVAKRADLLDALADHVDADHHLDGVVAELVGVLEGVGRGLGVDRCVDRANREATTVPVSRSGAELVETVEDDALAQGPRADLELVEVEDVHTADATSAPATTWWARFLETPGRSAISSLVHVQQLGDPLVEVGGRRGCGVRADPRSRALRRRSAPASGRSSRSRRRGRARRRAASVPASWAIGGADVLAQLAQPLVVQRRLRPRSARGSADPAPSGSDQATSGDSSSPAGDLERAAADVEDGEAPRGPPEPATYGQEGQPGLVLAGEHLDLDTGALLATWREHVVAVVGVADRRGREGVDLLAALVLGQLEGVPDELDERVDALVADRCRPSSRCSASRSGSLTDDAGIGAAPR